MTDFLERIASFARTQPAQPAFCCSEGSLTYGALWEQAGACADLLQRQGTSPVILFGSKRLWMPVALLACIRAGRAYVPLHPATPKARMETILSLTGATLVLTDAPLDISAATCCPLEGLSAWKDAPPQPCSSETVYMIFTSGSTGVPKGVPISRRNLATFVDWISQLEPLSGYRQCKVLNQANFSFDLSVADLYYALCNGHTLVALDDDVGMDVARIYETFAVNLIQVAVLTPTFAKLCLLHPDFNRQHLPALQCIYFCGEPLEKDLVRRLLRAFPTLQILNAYGPTEATSAVSAIRITAEMLEEARLPVGTVGQFATDIEIDNGEIVLKGDSVFSGYLGGIAGGHFLENGVHCYRTGDAGMLRDGKLYCCGRLDDQVKFKGYRIELGEIEWNLRQIAGVRDCAVVEKRSAEGVVKTIQAFLVLDGDQTTADVKAALQSRLPHYMIPKTFRQLDALPVNQNGKTDRKALREL